MPGPFQLWRVCWLLTVVASVAEHRLSGVQAAVAVALGSRAQASIVVALGLVAPWHVGPSRTRDPAGRFSPTAPTGEAQRITFKLENPFHIVTLADIIIVIIPKRPIFFCLFAHSNSKVIKKKD